jgi:hypothetical protein
MKNNFKILLGIAIMLTSSVVSAQVGGVGINTTTPDTSAVLDITSVNKGLLVPRLSTTMLSDIVLPVIGLLVFNTINNQFTFNNRTDVSP